MRMYKAISYLCIFGAIGSAQSVQMTPQIQALLDEKARKIEELEKCDSKRKAFVVAGISTLGLTAVGIGGNIALANKNKKLDAELADKKSELSSKKTELSQLQYAELMPRAESVRANTDQNVQEGTQAAKTEEPSATTITLDPAVKGTGYCYKDIDRAGESNESGCKQFSAMTYGDWGVIFPEYEVYGKAVCNDTGGTRAVASGAEQSNTGGPECWCKMTEPMASSWVFRGTWNGASVNCANHCAFICAFGVLYYADFRGAVFGVTQ